MIYLNVYLNDIFVLLSKFCFIGNIASALEMTNELLELQPGHERAMGNKLYYEGEMESVKLPKFADNLRGDDGSDDLKAKVKS